MIIGNAIIVSSGNSGGGGGEGEATLITKRITANGEYKASADNADGYSKVTVAVPAPTVIAKTFTSNGTYRAADEGAAGYDVVTVNVVSGGDRCPRAEPVAEMQLDEFFSDFSFEITAAEVTD